MILAVFEDRATMQPSPSSAAGSDRDSITSLARSHRVKSWNWLAEAGRATMPSRKGSYFRVVYYDSEKKTCGVSEIVTDDKVVADRTAKLQATGRKVHISTTNPEPDLQNVPSVATVLQKLASMGYSYDPDLCW